MGTRLMREYGSRIEQVKLQLSCSRGLGRPHGESRAGMALQRGLKLNQGSQVFIGL